MMGLFANQLLCLTLSPLPFDDLVTHFILVPNNTSFYVCATVDLPIFLLKDILVTFQVLTTINTSVHICIQVFVQTNFGDG